MRRADLGDDRHAANLASRKLTTVVKLPHDLRMSRQTMSFALPDSMRDYIDARVASGNYGNTSEYIRDLVRRDQDEQARKRLRDLIEEGLASGPGRRRTPADRKQLLAIARGEIE
jgi:antitoxin ParD1/3/4